METRPQEIGNSFGVQGRLTYADYSPLEDDRNLVEVIKEFVSLVSTIGRMDVNNKKLSALASDSDRLRQDIISAIKHIKTDTGLTMEKFHDDHADVLSNDLLTKGSALLMETKNSLSELLSSTESGFDEQHAKYRDKITSKITENNKAAFNQIQTWLAADYRNLPRPILLHLDMSVSASIDKKTGRNYEITRTISSSTAEDNPVANDALQFSYTFRIDPSELEFWNFRRNVTDLGIKDLMLPAGMRAPVSEKIKQTFRFGSRKDTEIMKEPEFVKVDGYFLVSGGLQGEKTLVVELARDQSRPLEDIFKITYDVSSLSIPAQPGVSTTGSSPFPRIDYTSKVGSASVTESDLLQIAEIRSGTDMSKLRLLGAAVLARLRAFQDPQLIRSRGRLAELRTRNDTAVIPTAVEAGEYKPLFEFLGSIAYSYSPFVKKMQQKAAVTGELTLREELGGGQRKEYSVRADDLRAQLRETDHGKSVASALGL